MVHIFTIYCASRGGVLNVYKKGSKLVKFRKTCKIYISDLEIKKKKAK